MDIARHRSQVHVILDQFGLEASLEQVPWPAVLVAGIKRIGRQQTLHEGREVRPRRTY